jgi:hypothetical protein
VNAQRAVLVWTIHIYGTEPEEEPVKEYRVKPGGKLSLKEFDPEDTGDYKKNEQGKAKAKAETANLIAKLDGLQERLYAGATR